MQPLYLAVGLALMTGLGHSILSEQLFLRPLRAEAHSGRTFDDPRARRLATGMFHFASVAWVTMALCILLLDPTKSADRSMLLLFAVVYGLSGAGNFWAVGKPHMGGVLLFATSAAISAGLYL